MFLVIAIACFSAGVVLFTYSSGQVSAYCTTLVSYIDPFDYRTPSRQRSS